MTQTEALKLALEALEESGITWKTSRAIAAIKEVLSTSFEKPEHEQELCPSCKNGDIYACTCIFKKAQPAVAEQHKQEPYGYLKLNTGKFVNEVEGLNPMKDKRYLPLYTTPPQSKKTEQKPVAHFGSAYVNENGVHVTTVLGPVAIPQDAKLYTTPPQRKPLTDEEIAKIASTPAAVVGSYVHTFARAIEAAHGIKE